MGPSIPLARARELLPDAEFHPPIRRGDLKQIPGGTVVGIIDGLFAQTLAISPGEIRAAVHRGVAIYGAASLGALRAAEVKEVIGVGRIFEMYRDGVIERDDEVALMIDPDSHAPLTESLVNVRYAVERLVRSTTLGRDDGESLVHACAGLHYTERTYPNIFARSKLAQNADRDDVIRLLRTFNLKRDDAQSLLEHLASVEPPTDITPIDSIERTWIEATPSAKRAHDREPVDAPAMVWESGDTVAFPDLVRFLKLTGRFEAFMRNAVARAALGGTPLAAGALAHPEDLSAAAQFLLDMARVQWGWETPEEAHVTMRDLGLGLDDVAEWLETEAVAERAVARAGAADDERVAKALRTELWINDLSLKREVLRLGALRFFDDGSPADETELADARRTIARLRGAMQWTQVRSDLRGLGVADTELDEAVRELAVARRVARPVVEALDRPASPAAASARGARWRALGLALDASPKAPDSDRFGLSMPEAAEVADLIAKQMGIRRIGLVGELDTLGVYIAQAFGERRGWSSSFSSGKSLTREGARVGSIMEEAEIHAQDAYRGRGMVRRRFAEGPSGVSMVDPHDLDLPYDSRYTGSLEIEWAECFDLLGNTKVLVPAACLIGDRLANDVYYSPRLGGKIFGSNGLASGFSLTEAIVHAAAEYIERHSLRLAELELDNPSGIGLRQFWFVNLNSLPETPHGIVERYQAAGASVRVLDMTSEIRVPTFYARVFDDPFTTPASMSSDGFACHPDPEVAVTMALLEAAQTRGGYIAGGREDYSLQARSLGRHERPRTAVRGSHVFWFSNDRPERDFAAIQGLRSRDILEELEWIVDRVEAAGFERFLVADMTMERIVPAHAVRVMIPGMESTNPLFTGERGRATCIRDLLPRGVEAPAPAPAAHWDPAALAFHRSSRRLGFQRRSQSDVPAVAPRRAADSIPLPSVPVERGVGLAEALEARCSRRMWSDEPLPLETLGRLLWSSARNRDAEPGQVSRPYPSGGAAYSLELYPVLGPAAVETLAAGIYRYLPDEHALEMVTTDDAGTATILEAAGASAGTTAPPIALVITSRYARQAEPYGTLAYGLVLKEVGGLFQTLYLVGESLGLACCALGGGTPTGLFARLTGTSDLDDPVVGELMLGPGEWRRTRRG